MGKVLCRRSIECFLPSSAAHLEESSPEEYDDDDKDNDGVANIMMRGYGKIKASVSSLVSTVVLLHDFHQQVNIGVRDGSKHSQDTIDDSHANEYGSEEAMNDPHDRRLLLCLENSMVNATETGLQEHKKHDDNSDELMGAIIML